MNKKKGWGSLSIILFIIGLLFPLNIGRTFCLGEILLGSIGLKGWVTHGNSSLNIMVFISEFLFIAGFILGKVFKNDKYAKVGRILCLTFGIIIGISLLYFVILVFPAFRRIH